MGLHPLPDAPLALTADEPTNDLERAVRAFMDGSSPPGAFVSTLVESQVFLLVEGEPEAIPEIAGKRALVLPSSLKIPSVCLFTSSERSYEVQREHPAYRTGLLVDFRWVLKGMPAGLGFVLNPGSSLTLEQPPEGVEKMKSDFA